MRHLQLVSHGEPSQVVELKTFSEPDLGEDDVRISMEAAPINPSDFLLIRGRYGVRPTLPFGLGAEGSAGACNLTKNKTRTMLKTAWEG